MEGLVDRLRRALAGVRATPAPAPLAPPSDEGEADLVDVFERALAHASGRLVRVPDRGAAKRWVQEAYAEHQVVWADERPDEATLRASEVGVDVADLLVAQTGTVVRTFDSAAHARVSLVPPVSVFLASTADLVRDPATALERVAEAHRAGRAYTTWITGPSRTADIEKQLVIPAHGPRELVVVLAEAS